MKPILLATQSKYKIALFEKLGVPFDTASPPYEEHLIEGLTPCDLAVAQSEGKARSLAASWPEHLIIGADQVLALGDQIFTKPGSVEAAVQQLQALSGATHQLHTGFCVLDSGEDRATTEVVTSHITFHDHFDEDWLRELVLRDETWDCVGAYKFESGGIMLMKDVAFEDPNAIVGLPLMRLVTVLAGHGYFQNRFKKT